MNHVHEYDLAFSFAGEHREYVERTKVACEKLGLRIFYDRDVTNDWWGKNFIREQRKVYGARSLYFVAFISNEYLLKPIPADEFDTAIRASIQRQDEYILPVLIGRPTIPPDLLPPFTHYLEADRYTPEQLADEMYKKVEKARGANRESREVLTVMSDAINLRLPRVVPAEFSKYQELRTVLQLLGDRFKSAVSQLISAGYVGTVDQRPDKVSVRVERSGETVYALDIRESSGRDSTLEFALNQHRSYGNAYNATAQPYFDRDAGTPKLQILDFSLLGLTGQGYVSMTKEELFAAIWERMVTQLESCL